MKFYLFIEFQNYEMESTNSTHHKMSEMNE